MKVGRSELSDVEVSESEKEGGSKGVLIGLVWGTWG